MWFQFLSFRLYLSIQSVGRFNFMPVIAFKCSKNPMYKVCSDHMLVTWPQGQDDSDSESERKQRPPQRGADDWTDPWARDVPRGKRKQKRKVSVHWLWGCTHTHTYSHTHRPVRVTIIQTVQKRTRRKGQRLGNRRALILTVMTKAARKRRKKSK